MSEEPRVSVLLPVRDARATLGAALRSVARQSAADFECWIVDDGSQDGSLELAARVAETDPRFRLLPGARRGLVPTLQDGLARCRGAFVARMDADDLMHRRRLELQLAALAERPELAAVGSRVRMFPRAQLGEGMRAYERWLNAVDSPERVAREAFVECPIAHPTLMLRTPLIRRFGWRDTDWPEDYDLLLRLIEAGHALDVVPRRLLAWRHSPSRLSRNHPRYGHDRFTACKASFLARAFLGEGDDYLLWGYGGTGRALRRALLPHGKRPSHIVELHPGRLGNAIHGAPVVPPEALRSLPRRPLLVSVAGEANRQQIRSALAEMGFRETRDFLCAA